MSRGSDFWSRRKARVEAEEVEEARKAEAAEIEAKQKQLEEKSDADILEELGLPDPDSLEPGQDIAGFMNKAVPERLRRRAMRQLWRLNPVLANLDGLNDYDDDFTNAVTDAPGVKTAYQVGKGLLRHVQALEAQERTKGMADAGEGLDTPQNLSDITLTDADAENPSDPVPFPENMQENANAAGASATKVVGPEAADDYANGTPLDTVTEEPVRPRRMRFRIESETG
ncbi:DUF3306 domain-containing protein [Marivita sp. XM-24bin2]|jgi:hypothetical protein|uniref:DUF3306 domain-containing protein n=1 Tax=unclassified Marivita TaxID=2632480 RepID=UPI000D79F232|nr:DUF3306 domain-containing protein [Marivita sp. XM-24bin2]MCR9110664.1 DUF3306 domain-containing protein [Paracoccaceae bacterium]PWL34016.1 MAG: DUF3306 domain-containing protein [Marivita sp. XM-24bin2]